MLSELSLLLIIWILTPIAIIAFLFHCLAFKTSNDVAAEREVEGLWTSPSTKSKIWVSAALFALVVAGIILSISASKYFEVLRIVESNGSPPSDTVDSVIQYHYFISLFNFGCLLMVKISILISYKGLKEPVKNMWTANRFVLMISFGIFLLQSVQAFSPLVCISSGCRNSDGLSINEFLLWAAIGDDILSDVFLILLPVLLIIRASLPRVQQLRACFLPILVRVTILVAIVIGVMASIQEPIERIGWNNILGFVEGIVSVTLTCVFSWRRMLHRRASMKKKPSMVPQTSLRSPRSAFEA